jgi:hypothetical protein
VILFAKAGLLDYIQGFDQSLKEPAGKKDLSGKNYPVVQDIKKLKDEVYNND